MEMHKLLFAKPLGSHLTLLFLGAHSDDIEIGCGGTILKLLTEYNVKKVHWVVFAARDNRAKEARQSAGLFLHGSQETSVAVHPFRDGYLPYSGSEIKDAFENLKSAASPDIIFTHYRHDLHQDHRIISELTWNTFRDHLILEYEVVKYDGDLGSPNLFVSLTEETCRKKTDNLHRCFKSQADRKWFSDDTFLSMLRIRGVESNASDGYAEAFYCRKMVI
jgi:LmbE family N-acetylglucosaminyl deacetylase